MNTNESTKIKDLVKDLNMLRLAFVIGLLLITGLMYFVMMKDSSVSFSDEDGMYSYLCPLLAIGGIVMGKWLYTRRLATLDHGSDPDHKLLTYRQASLLEYALLEGTALFCVLGGVMTQNALYTLIALALVAYLFSKSKSVGSVKSKLNL